MHRFIFLLQLQISTFFGLQPIFVKFQNLWYMFRTNHLYDRPGTVLSHKFIEISPFSSHLTAGKIHQFVIGINILRIVPDRFCTEPSGKQLLESVLCFRSQRLKSNCCPVTVGIIQNFFYGLLNLAVTRSIHHREQIYSFLFCAPM